MSRDVIHFAAVKNNRFNLVTSVAMALLIIVNKGAPDKERVGLTYTVNPRYMMGSFLVTINAELCFSTVTEFVEESSMEMRTKSSEFLIRSATYGYSRKIHEMLKMFPQPHYESTVITCTRHSAVYVGDLCEN